MIFYNLKHPKEEVNFKQAVLKGMGQNQGLFFPKNWPEFDSDTINELLEMSFVERSVRLFQRLLNDELDDNQIERIVCKAFNFPIKLEAVNGKISALELFHGPTLAFKDFGCRFFAACIEEFAKDEELTIVTATSGDTGAAVAHAFYQVPNVNVHVLYPDGKVSLLQEKIFCTLGNNIHTYAVKSNFDACQSMVKQAFEDTDINNQHNLNSANSINVSRLMAQMAYYFELVANLKIQKKVDKDLVVSVPCGNFGNLTAGLLAKSLGLPIKRFIVGTNDNDTVPRYLQDGNWNPYATIETISNAMDISRPSNWPRVETLLNYKEVGLSSLEGLSFSDKLTKKWVMNLFNMNYLCEPHGAIAYAALEEKLIEDEYGVFLCTAHPIKFHLVMKDILDRDLPIPSHLRNYLEADLLSRRINHDFNYFKDCLLS